MKSASKKFFAALLACLMVGALAVPALALSGAEYRKMLKDPEFAAADKELNRVWAELKKSMSKEAFKLLEKDRDAWVSKGRDEDANARMKKEGLSRTAAYAAATRARTKALPGLAQQYASPKPKASPKTSPKASPKVSEKRMVEVTLVNKRDEKVFVAIARHSYDENDVKTSISKGWWTVEPGETRTIRPFEFDDNAYLYYATSGEYVWETAEELTDHYWIHPTEAFESHQDKAIPGGKRVAFNLFDHPRNYKGWRDWKGWEPDKEEAGKFILTFLKDYPETYTPEDDDDYWVWRENRK